MAPDKPYYYVQLFTCLALVGIIKDVTLGTPHWIATHISWGFTFFMMNLTWQITRRTDPGTFGLRDERIYQAEYKVAIEEMIARVRATHLVLATSPLD
jgi:hypothetical protein